MGEAEKDGRGVRKQRRGVVASRSGDKSVVVIVGRKKRHPLYGKVVKYAKKFHAHDEKNVAKVGDEVLIVECRPMSKLKRWRLQEVVGGGDR